MGKLSRRRLADALFLLTPTAAQGFHIYGATRYIHRKALAGSPADRSGAARFGV